MSTQAKSRRFSLGLGDSALPLAAALFGLGLAPSFAFAAAPEGNAGHGGGFSLFNWPSEMGEPVGIVFMLINFGILLLILNRIIFTPLRQKNAERSDRIASELKRATQARQEAEELLKQSKDRLDHIERESKEVIDQAKRRAEASRQEILGKAQAEADRIVQNARDFAEREQKRLRDEIEAEIVERAVNQAESRIREVFSSQDQSRFIDQYAQEVRQLDLASALESTKTGKSSLEVGRKEGMN